MYPVPILAFGLDHHVLCNQPSVPGPWPGSDCSPNVPCLPAEDVLDLDGFSQWTALRRYRRFDGKEKTRLVLKTKPPLPETAAGCTMSKSYTHFRPVRQPKFLK